MTRKSQLMLASGLAAVAMSMAAAPTMAQTTTDAGQDSVSRLDDIVVVSRKRASGEALQDTPIAATAFGAQQLEEAGVKDLTDVGRMAPSVSLQPSSQKGVQNFAIRGMGVSGSTPSDEPAVGIFQDGIYWGSNYGALNELFDMEGVEILRGPQGTLFGRNVTGGAVSVRSARPSFNPSGEGTIGIGNYGAKEASGVITGPLIGDKLAGRLAVQTRRLDGYFTNTVTGSDYGESDSYIVRPSLTWQASPTFSVTALAEWYSDTGDPTVSRGIAPCTIPGCTPNLPTTEGFVTSDDFYEVAYNEPGSNDVDVFLGVIEANWDVFGGVLTSVTGVRNVSTRVVTDYDGTPSAGFLQQIAQDQEQFSTELRFAADVNNFLSYTVGLYYFDQKFDFRERRSLNNDLTNIATRSHLDNDSFAAFVDADFNITDKLTVTAGVRYTEETKTASAAAFGACSLDWETCTFTGPLTTKDDNISPRISVGYDIDDNQLVYASATRGFRSGGFSLRGTALIEPYRAEEVTAYEIGYKGDLFDRRLRVNLAAYQNTYDDLQRTVLGVSESAGVVQSVFNAAAATVTGAEVEVTAIVTNGFELTAAYGYTDAQYDEFLGVIDPGSRKFVRIPENTGTIAARYEHNMEDGAQLVARAAAQYTGDYFYDDTNLLQQDAYTLVDASVAYTNPTGVWTVTVWGKNLTEEEYSPWGSTLGFLGENRFPAAPRTFGIRLQARY
ncbi:TonB-dependent receptor [Brevundimonas sp.]|uniref:TonB-dependent receptor n=1 Tax=Brevundimonas sp. TaxID=1871086 RepID=UPI003BA8D614